MKFPLMSVVLFAATVTLTTTRAEERHLGPPVYLAALHELEGRAVLHWKYNIARPEFVEVKVADSEGREVARVRRPARQVDVTGRTGPFRLIPLQADGSFDTEVVVPVGAIPFLVWLKKTLKISDAVSPAELPLPPVPAISRIGIRRRDGRAEFVELATGKVFHPAGMNYVPLRHGDHAAFEAATSVGKGFYDPLEAESMLRLLSENGYNTVRVFLAGRKPENPGLSGEHDTGGLYSPYLDNLADFLKRSAANGIHVIFNFCDVDLPRNRYFRDRLNGKDDSENLFCAEGVLACREMVASTLAYLKAKNPDLLKTILGVQFNNEIYAKLSRWPFNEKGPVTTANGKTYDMSVPAERARCYEEGLEYYYRQVCAAVKDVDPALLTCDSVFVAAAIGRDHRQGAAAFDLDHVAKGFEWDTELGSRVPPSLVVLARSPLDFVDVHLYPAGKLSHYEQEVEDLLESSRFRDAVAEGLCSEKPVILGEFGAFKAQVKNDTDDGLSGGMRRWSEIRRLACGKFGFVGYLGWSLETFAQTDIFQALAFGPDFLRKFRGEFSWPVTGPDASPDPKAAAKIPLVLSPVPPTGRANGFLVPQKLMP